MKLIGLILIITIISSCSKTVYFYESNYGEKIYLVKSKKKFYRQKQNCYHILETDINTDSNQFEYKITEKHLLEYAKIDYFEYDISSDTILYKKEDQKFQTKLILNKDSIQVIKSLPIKFNFLKYGLVYSNNESLRHFHTKYKFYVKYIGDSIHMLNTSPPLTVHKFEYYYSLNDNYKDLSNPIIVSFDSKSGVPVYLEYHLKSVNEVLLNGTTNCIDIVKLRISRKKLNKLLVSWNP